MKYYTHTVSHIKCYRQGNTLVELSEGIFDDVNYEYAKLLAREEHK